MFRWTATLLLLAAPPLAAQSGPSDDIEEVVVTGSSLRGVAPVGSAMASVGREEIEETSYQTTQEILKLVPSISNSQAIKQPQGGQLVGSSYFAPTIHSLGSSASTSTLVLIDGHRIPLGNVSHPQPDPSIIPMIAIERIEVVADGASAIYGSDAVAGVINFITRDGYDGLMVTAQTGFGDGYSTRNASLLWGTGWEDGSAMIAYGYTHHDPLARKDRPILSRDQRPRGGTNFKDYACEPATISINGTTYRSASDATVLTEPICEEMVSDFIQGQVRHDMMAKVSQRFTDSLSTSLDLVYSWRENEGAVSRGVIQGTAFGSGPQANPFYTNPPGVTGEQQTIRFLADELLGPGAYTVNSGEVYYASGEIEYDLAEDYRLRFLGLTGRTRTINLTDGTVCTSCAFLGLNGTTNGGGDPTLPSIPGTNIIVSNYPLTEDTALDVWNPAATNRTSDAVLAALASNRVYQRANQTLKQARLIVDGPLFQLPGGSVLAAVGAEFTRYTLSPHVVRSNNTGPYDQGSSVFDADIERDVKSIFGEIMFPLLGPASDIPLVQGIELTAALRHDDYAVFGGTTNPKVGLNWEVNDSIKLRASWSESFVAPPLTTAGHPQGLATFSGYSQDGSRMSLPLEFFPEARQLPGCEDAVDFCIVGAGTERRGVYVLSGDPTLVPQTGKSFSFGGDFAFDRIPLNLSVTWFENSFRGGITAPNANMIVNTPGLRHLIRITPHGATPEEIQEWVGAAPQNGPLPATTYYLLDRDMNNVVNLDIAGLDIAGRYDIESSFGSIAISGSITHFAKFDQFFGDGENFSVLGTQGFNQTFSSVETQARVNLLWRRNDWSVGLFANYTSDHRNWSSGSIEPIGLRDDGNPDGTGGDRVGSYTTFDLNIGYQLSPIGRLEDTRVFLDITDVFDREPPFYNSPDGFGPYHASPIGRVATIGIRAVW